MMSRNRIWISCSVRSDELTKNLVAKGITGDQAHLLQSTSQNKIALPVENVILVRDLQARASCIRSGPGIDVVLKTVWVSEGDTAQLFCPTKYKVLNCILFIAWTLGCV